MNVCRVLRTTIVLGLAAGFVASAGAAETIGHRFLALDFWHGKLYHVDQLDPARNWELPTGGGVKDMQLVGQGRLMISAGDGYVVYDLAKESRRVAQPGTVRNGHRPPPSGRLDVAGPNSKKGVTIFAVSPSGQIVRRVSVPGLKTLRMMRFTAEGTLLLTELEGASEITLDASTPAEKRIVRQFKLPRPRNAYMALQSADGSYWVAGGYAHALYQYRADGRLLRSFEADQPPGFSNWFYAGFQMLKNGHVVQANWTGHSEKDFKEGWKVVEFDRGGKVVWHWHVPREQAGTINGLIVLDDLDPALPADDAEGVLRSIPTARQP